MSFSSAPQYLRMAVALHEKCAVVVSEELAAQSAGLAVDDVEDESLHFVAGRVVDVSDGLESLEDGRVHLDAKLLVVEVADGTVFR
jgi:hypothetical protein